MNRKSIAVERLACSFCFACYCSGSAIFGKVRHQQFYFTSLARNVSRNLVPILLRIWPRNVAWNFAADLARICFFKIILSHPHHGPVLDPDLSLDAA